MESDNLALQADEIEALSAIYEEDWKVIDTSNRTYAIDIRGDSSEKSEFMIHLQVTLPENYPTEAPPTYMLNAPWLRGNDKQDIQNALEEIYAQNMGESIIFLWVDKIRELLQEFSDKMNIDRKQDEDENDEESEEDSEWDPSVLGDYTQYKYTKAEKQAEHVSVVPVIHTGGIVEDRKSVFQPHIAAVTSVEEVGLVMDKLKENKKIAAATHNIIAYRIQEEGKPIMQQGCEDDGEFGAGARMLHLLQIVDAKNVLVVVTRWYGGIHLGPDRFKHINNCARTMLVSQGFITEKESSSKKKGKQKS